MNRQKWTMLVVALALIAGAAGVLTQLRRNQKLGPPGVTTHPVAGSIRLEVDLPAHVLDYDSERKDVDDIVLKTLPDDTSFGERWYKAPDGFQVQLRVVLMGTDRTSMHKPQFCLTGSGWNIDPEASAEVEVPVERPFRYELPVVKLVATKQGMVNGEKVVGRAVYVYWFVADDALSAGVAGFHRNWLMAKTLLRTGVLQRWAYVSCFAICAPGQEQEVFERITKFISASVPDFQLMPRAAVATASARP